MLELSYHNEATMNIDYRSLAILETSIKEPAEAAKLDLEFILENVMPEAVSEVSWTPGYYNIADGLTKDNKKSPYLLICALCSTLHPRNPETIMNSEESALQLHVTDYPVATDDITIRMNSRKRGV